MELTPCIDLAYFCRSCCPNDQIREVVEDSGDLEVLPASDVCPRCGGLARSRHLGRGETIRPLPYAQLIRGHDLAERTDTQRRAPILSAQS